jgi:hypothetical protein
MATPHLDLAVGRYDPDVNLSIRHNGDKPHPTSLHIFNIFKDLVSHVNPKTPLSSAQEIDSLYLSQATHPASDQDSKLSPEDFLCNLWEIFLDIVEKTPSFHPVQDKLISFVVALSSLTAAPGPKGRREKEIDAEGTRQILWRDLPFLKEVAKQELICTSSLLPPISLPHRNIDASGQQSMTTPLSSPHNISPTSPSTPSQK